MNNKKFAKFIKYERNEPIYKVWGAEVEEQGKEVRIYWLIINKIDIPETPNIDKWEEQKNG